MGAPPITGPLHWAPSTCCSGFSLALFHPLHPHPFKVTALLLSLPSQGPPPQPGAHGFLEKNSFHDIQTVNIRGPGQPGPGPVLPAPVPATLTCLCFLTHTQHPDAFVPGQTRLGCLLPLLLLPPYPCLPPASGLLQRTCSQRLSITVPQPLPGTATSSQGLLKPRVESQLFVCIFHLLHQTGSSPRADTGFESPLLPGITQSRAGPKEDTL